MSQPYRVEGDRVVHDDHYIGVTDLDADAASFRVVRDASIEALPDYDWCFGARPGPRYDFAADRTSVWFMNVRVPDADPGTFEGFYGGQCNWGRDHDHVWCFYGGPRPRVKPMKTALVESFGFFPTERCSAYMREYARDARRVYYYGRRVTGAQPDSFESVPEDEFLPDRMRTSGLARRPDPRSDYHRDANHIWYKGRKVVGADVASFRALEGGFGVDRSGFWDWLDPIGRQLGREHFDLYVASRPELAAGDWDRLAAPPRRRT